MSQGAKRAYLLVRLWSACGLCVGVLSGIGSAIFIHSLRWATDTRLASSWFLWLLPLAGLGVGLLRRVAGRVTAGSNLLLDEYHHAGDEQLPVPVRIAPYVYIGSVVTHLFGGSGGREGAAVQIAAGLSAPVRPWLVRLGQPIGQSEDDVRSMMVVAALAGGFGSVFGVPFAGAIFGIEVLRRWRADVKHVASRWVDAQRHLPAAVLASFLGNVVTTHLGIHHVPLSAPTRSWHFGILVVAIASGLLARSYLRAHHVVTQVLAKSRVPELVKPCVGGLAVVLLVLVTGTRAYLGLSLPLLNAALAGSAVVGAAFALKLLFTAITLGSGFPGGEVTPLLCMGACLGATLAGPLNGPRALFAAVGMVATWAAASNTPLSSAVMGAELFGIGVLPMFLPTAVVAMISSGPAGVYRAQH